MTLRLTPNRFPHTTGHAAQQDLSGVISRGATWSETITIVDANGDQVTGVGSDEFRLQLRKYPEDEAVDLDLTTGDSELTVTVGGSSTTLAISAAQSTLSGLDVGDYVCDIVSLSGSTLTHRAHGTVTVTNSPIAFS